MNQMLPAFFLFISLQSFSQQKRYVYYFDSNMKMSAKSKSYFNGTGNLDSGLIELKCYKNEDNSLVFVAHFIDSSLKTFQGLFRSYYRNGNLENLGEYFKGRENGLWQRWDSLGNIIDSAFYKDGVKLMNATFTYHQNQNIESILIDDIKNKKLHRIYYDEAGKTMINDTLDESSDDENNKDVPQFPGGNIEWQNYIQSWIYANIDALKEENRTGTCIIRFMVNEKGKVSQLDELTMQGSMLAKIIVSAIAHGPKWKPARENGKRIKAYKDVPVIFNVNKL